MGSSVIRGLALVLVLGGCAASAGGDADTPGESAGSEIRDTDPDDRPETTGESATGSDDERGLLSAGERSAPPSRLRVMSYNIKYGAESDLDLSKLADVIRTSNPDVIGLQEVDEGTRRSGGKKETDELSALTGMPHRFFGSNFDFDGGQYGLAILSKYPIINPRVVRLDDRTTRTNGYEPRIAVAAEIDLGSERITFVTVHASLHEAERGDNGDRIVSALSAAGAAGARRSIVCGDFNETPGKAIGDRLATAGLVDAYHEKHPLFGFTQPASFPLKRIDFIWRGSAFGATAHAWVPDSKASDHRPVAAVIPLR